MWDQKLMVYVIPDRPDYCSIPLPLSNVTTFLVHNIY